jgi:hypothetical protein
MIYLANTLLEATGANSGVVLLHRPMPLALRNAVQMMLSAAALAETTKAEAGTDVAALANKTVIDTLLGRRIEIGILVMRGCLIGLRGVSRETEGDLLELPRAPEMIGGLMLPMVPHVLISELCEHALLGADLDALAQTLMKGQPSEAEKKS